MIGLSNAIRMFWNWGISASGETESDINVMPYIRTEKPQRIVPMSFFFCSLQPIIMMTPMIATIGAKFCGFSMDTKMLSEEMPFRERIQAVSVVPISDPMITFTVEANSIIPELTRPTSMTVRAEDD